MTDLLVAHSGKLSSWKVGDVSGWMDIDKRGQIVSEEGLLAVQSFQEMNPQSMADFAKSDKFLTNLSNIVIAFCGTVAKKGGLEATAPANKSGVTFDVFEKALELLDDLMIDPKIGSILLKTIRPKVFENLVTRLGSYVPHDVQYSTQEAAMSILVRMAAECQSQKKKEYKKYHALLLSCMPNTFSECVGDADLGCRAALEHMRPLLLKVNKSNPFITSCDFTELSYSGGSDNPVVTKNGSMDWCLTNILLTTDDPDDPRVKIDYGTLSRVHFADDGKGREKSKNLDVVLDVVPESLQALLGVSLADSQDCHGVFSFALTHDAPMDKLEETAMAGLQRKEKENEDSMDRAILEKVTAARERKTSNVGMRSTSASQTRGPPKSLVAGAALTDTIPSQVTPSAAAAAAAAAANKFGGAKKRSFGRYEEEEQEVPLKTQGSVSPATSSNVSSPNRRSLRGRRSDDTAAAMSKSGGMGTEDTDDFEAVPSPKLAQSKKQSAAEKRKGAAKLAKEAAVPPSPDSPAMTAKHRHEQVMHAKAAAEEEEESLTPTKGKGKGKGKGKDTNVSATKKARAKASRSESVSKPAAQQQRIPALGSPAAMRRQRDAAAAAVAAAADAEPQPGFDTFSQADARMKSEARREAESSARASRDRDRLEQELAQQLRQQRLAPAPDVYEYDYHEQYEPEPATAVPARRPPSKKAAAGTGTGTGTGIGTVTQSMTTSRELDYALREGRRRVLKDHLYVKRVKTDLFSSDEEEEEGLHEDEEDYDQHQQPRRAKAKTNKKVAAAAAAAATASHKGAFKPTMAAAGGDSDGDLSGGSSGGDLAEMEIVLDTDDDYYDDGASTATGATQEPSDRITLLAKELFDEQTRRLHAKNERMISAQADAAVEQVQSYLRVWADNRQKVHRDAQAVQDVQSAEFTAIANAKIDQMGREDQLLARRHTELKKGLLACEQEVNSVMDEIDNFNRDCKEENDAYNKGVKQRYEALARGIKRAADEEGRANRAAVKRQRQFDAAIHDA